MNLLSIFLGLISLLAAFRTLRTGPSLKGCIISLAACGGALVCQLAELYRLTRIQDTAAIYDTAHARLLAACWLLGLTVGGHLLSTMRPR